jgi:hypothetical protein
MKKVQDIRGYERYMALDIHREYLLVLCMISNLT